MHTTFQYKEELGEIRSDNYGRILGKGGRNVYDMQNKFGVKIAVSKPENDTTGHIKVTVTSGCDVDRYEAIQETIEQITVKVDVHFIFGSLRQEEIRSSGISFPYVFIQYNEKNQRIRLLWKIERVPNSI